MSDRKGLADRDSEFAELIQRLEEVASRDDGARLAAAAIRDLVADRETLMDKVEGLNADLRLAVQVAWRRGARVWVLMNYPSLVPWLESCDEAAVARDKALAMYRRGEP